MRNALALVPIPPPVYLSCRTHGGRYQGRCDECTAIHAERVNRSRWVLLFPHRAYIADPHERTAWLMDNVEGTVLP